MPESRAGKAWWLKCLQLESKALLEVSVIRVIVVGGELLVVRIHFDFRDQAWIAGKLLNIGNVLLWKEFSVTRAV